MKHRLLYIVFFSWSFILWGQSKVTVYDSDIRTVMEGAEVYCNHQLIGKTNAQGVLSFTTKCTEVLIKKKGYRTEKAVVDKFMQKSLFPEEEQEIGKRKLDAQSDKAALKILDEVHRKFEQNSPKSLSSYRYKSYEKLAVDINPDSISSYNQSLREALGNFDKIKWVRKKQQPDTVLTIKKVFANSQLFLWERTMEHLYSQKKGERKKILSNEMAGLKEPLNELLMLHTNRDEKMPKEIDPKNRNIYRYFLTDSVEIEGRKNWVIHFREVTYRRAIQKRLFNGYLYIDAETFGIKKIESNGKQPGEYKLTSIWTLQNGKWFLESENLKTKLYSVKIKPEDNDKQKLKKFKLYGFVTAKYFDFEPSAQVDNKEYRGYFYQNKAPQEPMAKYRSTPLNPREEHSYTVLSELSATYDLERKINGAAGLLDGNLRTKKIDWNVLKFLSFNNHEGFRVGAGAKLNETFHPNFSPDAYVAYGLKDEVLKYGLGVDYSFSKNRISKLRVEYVNDKVSAGRFSERLWDGIMVMSNANIAMNNRHYVNYKSFKMSYQYDVSNALGLEISASKNRESLVVPYSYNGGGNDFKFFTTTATLKYTPLFKYVKTPRGKFTVEKRYPEVYLNYEKSWNALGGQWDYSKADFLVNHVYENKWGTTGVRLYGGMVFGDAPLWRNYSANGLSSGSGVNFALFSYLGFVTMPSTKYYNDSFVGMYFMHTLPWHFKSIGQNTSSFSLVHRSIIGKMENAHHHATEFQPLDKLYQEVGVEWNNFLSSWFNLGIFYRVGHYSTPVFSENIGFQFKFRLLGF